MSVLLDLRARLLAGGYEGVVQLARLDATPDAVLALRQVPGEASVDRDGRERAALERLSVQMLVRGAANVGFAEPMQRAHDAHRMISGRHFTINTRRYDWVFAEEPYPYGYDDNDRPIALTTFMLQRWGDLEDE